MTNFFFARQPILDGTKSVFGYELLFRSSFQNVYEAATNEEHAALDVLSNVFFYSSFERTLAGKQGLVNFTRDLLLNDVFLVFSPEHFVIELLENMVPDGEVIAACRRSKKSGYRIALDDVTLDDLNNPLIALADFVKVDFFQAKGQDRELIAAKLLPLNITLIAEKVETDSDFREGLSLGYALFQGYFFSKPVVQSARRLEPCKIACMRMLQAVFKDQCDYKELNEIISTDMSLTFRMLRLANSPYFGFREEITSILHAITLLGYSGMKKFASLIAISRVMGNKPTELALTCLMRARMGEVIAPLIGVADRTGALFLTGLFSLLDALLDCPMKDALSELPLERDIKSALLGDRNILRNTLDTIVAYERGDWEQFRASATAINLQENLFPAIYTSAIKWATDIFIAI
jgi:c-di-GMP-related signal transduction protein